MTRCVRGGDLLLLAVLDWRPFDYITVRSAATGSRDGVVTTNRLVPTDGVTRLQISARLPGGPFRRRLSRKSLARVINRSKSVGSRRREDRW